MGWEEKKLTTGAVRQELSAGLNEQEEKIINLLKERESMHIEVINAISGFTATEHAATLLSLEMKDIIYSLPGRIYRLNKQSGCRNSVKVFRQVPADQRRSA